MDRQIPVSIVDCKDKVVVIRSDEIDVDTMDQMKKMLKKRGFDPIALILLPSEDWMESVDRDEGIEVLMSLIKQLESR